MKCALCGYEFEEEEGIAGCQGCALAGSCSMLRCPNCGYDNPRESRLAALLKKWREKKDGDNHNEDAPVKITPRGLTSDQYLAGSAIAFSLGLFIMLVVDGGFRLPALK